MDADDGATTIRVVVVMARTEDGVATVTLGVACNVSWATLEITLLVGVSDALRIAGLLTDVGGRIRVEAASVCEENAVTDRPVSVEDGTTTTTLLWLDEGCGKVVRGAGVLLVGDVGLPAVERRVPTEDGGITLGVLDARGCP